MARKPKPYDIQTSQEADALLRAIADGKTGRHWLNVVEATARVHQTPGAPHHVRLALSYSDFERFKDNLAGITARNDSDMDFALLYVTKQLTPTTPIPSNTSPRATIVLDDVITAIGWEPETKLQRQQMRRRIWQFLKFAAAIRIVGERSYKQRGKDGEIVETLIDSPPWVLGETEREVSDYNAAQLALFDDDAPPLSVGVMATPMWARLTMRPDTAQFISGAEILGAIPGGKAAGAWARCIGLALANLWRRNPREAVEGKIKPTRRELLERYSISVGEPNAVLAGESSRRALQYWHAALAILVKVEFIEASGEAALTLEQMRDALAFRNWGDDWLDGTMELRPGAAMLASIAERAEALPQRSDGSKPKSAISKPKSDGSEPKSDVS